MRKGLLTVLTVLASLFTANSVQAQGYYSVYNNTYSTDDEVAQWVSGLTDRYTVSRAGDDTNYYVDACYVGNGSNGTTITNTELSDLVGEGSTNAYKTADDYQVDFDIALTAGSGQISSFVISDTNGGTLVTFTATATSATTWDITNSASDTVAYDVTISKTTELTHVQIYGNETDGTMITIGDNDAVQLTTSVLKPGKMVYNTKRYYARMYFDNLEVKTYAESEVVADPTAVIVSANNASRSLTLSTVTSGATIYYSETKLAVGADGWTEYTDAGITTEADTIYAYAATETATSSVVSIATGAGTTLTLATPTISMGDYADGATTVTLSSDNSSITGTPTAQIVYSIDGGTETTIDNGSTVSVADGTSITFYATADGYENSQSVTKTAVAPNSNPEAISETYNSVVSANSNLVQGDESSLSGYYYITYDSGASTVSENLVSSSSWGSYDLIRANGLYFGGTRYLAIIDLKAGDYVTINGVYGNGSFSISNIGNGTLDEWNTREGTKYCIEVTDDGALTFSQSSYGYLQSITVQREAATTESVTVTDAGYATYVTTNAVETVDGVTLYAVTNGDDYVTLTEVTAAPANTPLLIAADAAGTYDLTIISEADAVTTDLIAATEDITCDGTQYVLAEVNGTVGFYKAQSETVLAAGKCYLVDETSTAAAKAIRIDGDVTGVAEVVAASETVTDGAAYNLAGQKVSANAKGIVIINGKKYINK